MFSRYTLSAIFYVLGIFISKSLDMSSVLFLALALSVITVVRAVIKRHINLTPLILALVLLFGGFRYYYEIQNHVYRAFPDKYVTVTGTIYSEPDPTGDDNEYRYVLKPDTVTYKDQTALGVKNILFYTDKFLDVGTKVTASGFLNEINGINNEHEFDFSLFYKGKNIFSQIYAKEIRIVGKDFILSAEFLGNLLASKVNTTITHHFDGESASFLKAILTGNKSGFSPEHLDLLIKTGVYRVLYSPFIHISLIFFLATVLFRDKNRRTSFILFSVVLYALANSSSPTIVKAAGVCGFFLFRKYVSGYADKLDILSKILLIMTVVDPLLCFNSGFVISIASSVIVYFSYSPIYTRLLRWFGKHKLKPASFWAKTLSLWIIFFIGTLPLCSYLFSGISVYAVLFMVLATPIVMAILILSPVMLLSLSIFDASYILAPIVGVLVDIIAFLPKIAEKLPAYYIRLAVPALAEIIIFYLLWWIFIRWTTFRFKTAKTMILATIVSGIILSGIPFIETNTLSMYFVNVGQGDGAVLHTSLGEAILIDGGGSTEYEDNYNIGDRVFVPYLTSHGFYDIDVAILSHCHKDHAEGIVAAAETLKIRTIVMPPTQADNIWHQKLLDVAKDKNIKIEYLSQGDELFFDSGLSIKFIEPSNTSTEDLNDTSLVAHISYGEFDALFTGDSPCNSIENYPENVELLKVAHHGSATANSKEFLRRVNPKYAVISVGKNNSYNLPSKTVIGNLKESGSTILCTDKMGDIQIKVKKDGKITYKTLKGE